MRRLVVRPARLTLGRSGIVILLLIGAIVAAELGALSYEAARYGPLPGAVLTNAFGVALAGADPALLEALFAAHWWAHIALVAAFLAWLPTTKHLHVVTSFFNVYLRKLEPRGALPAMDLEAEDATYGLRTLGDLAWKDVLDGFTCTECGRCQDACPATRPGKPLDPKALVMGIRHADAASAGSIIPNSPTCGPGGPRRPPGRGALAIPLVPGAIGEEAVWDCVTCGACVEACPVLIEHVDKIVGIRRNLVLEESRFPPELTPAFRAMESAQNPWGQPPIARLDWTKGLPFEVPTAAAVAAAGDARRAGGALLGRLRGGLRRAQPAGRPRLRDLPGRGRRPLRGAGAGGGLHRRPGAPHGQRVRLPAARRPRTSRRSGATGRRRSSPPARTASTRWATSTPSWAGRSG